MQGTKLLIFLIPKILSDENIVAGDQDGWIPFVGTGIFEFDSRGQSKSNAIFVCSEYKIYDGKNALHTFSVGSSTLSKEPSIYIFLEKFGPVVTWLRLSR